MEKRPDLGKNATWPEPPVGLRPFVMQLKKIHLNWRARKLVTGLKDEEKASLKQKIVASELLKGRRQYWGYQYQWHGNYLAKDTSIASKFGDAVMPLMTKNGDTKVVCRSTHPLTQTGPVLLVCAQTQHQGQDG